MTPDPEITLLLAKNAALRQHWAGDDTRIKEITKSVLPDFDTDGGGYFVDMVECAEAMAERIRELEGKWLPIESAPKDGREVWAFNGEQTRMKWIEGYALWIYGDEALADIDPYPEQPTHFMPLPQPPKERTTL